MDARHSPLLPELLAGDPAMARLLIDSVTDYAIFVLDPRGVVRTWNPGAHRLKGYTADEIVGHHISTFYTAADREAGLPGQLLARAERDGNARHSGWRVRRDGTRFWGDITITALREGGELVGFAKVTRDLTEQHEHELALRHSVERERAAAEELDHLHRRRTRLLSAIIHDLTTPITVVRSSLMLALGEPGIEGELGGLLADAHRNAEDLEQLRRQLQEFARIEGGAIELELVDVEVDRLAANLAQDLDSILPANSVVSEIPSGTRVRADALALRRILTNLVNNASRYAPADEPIRIMTGPSDAPDTIAIGVADRGPGISPEDRERVFQEFWSGRGNRRIDGGLGLGLSIVKGYVEEQGGQVWISGTEGGGATFWFTLPTPPAGDDR